MNITLKARANTPRLTRTLTLMDTPGDTLSNSVAGTALRSDMACERNIL